MKPIPAAAVLIRTIGDEIWQHGSCIITDSRLELIYAGAVDFSLKMHRLRGFGRTHGWSVTSRLGGRWVRFGQISPPRGTSLNCPEE